MCALASDAALMCTAATTASRQAATHPRRTQPPARLRTSPTTYA